MTRVAVIGNAGGGKSTLCRKLAAAKSLPLYPVDRMQWRPGWVAASSEEIKHLHDQALAAEKWIIDGWGSFDLIAERFAAADTIILVDHALIIHFGWAIKRQVGCIFRPRIDGPPGCPMLPMTWPLLKMIWQIHFKLRPQLLQLIDTYRESRTVYHIRSPKELRGFIQRLSTA